MATVADIEPASLALTPGEAEVFTLTVRNDGDEVEAYHLSAVDDAADHVVIEPDTLLVHPGETGTATATITLEHTGRWSVGEMIVRFHIVPAVRPDEFLVVEAIATIQSFTDVAAVLSPPTLEGRRSAEAEIAIANAGNAHTYADVGVSAGELVVSIDHAQAALPANSTESVDLTVRARDLLWRGDPVQHPFVVTVTPEGQPAISLEGTFTQRPLLPGWTFMALIGVGAAAALLLVFWLGAAILGDLNPTPSEEAAPPSTTETSTPEPVPIAVDVAFDLENDGSRAGDPVVAKVEVDADGAPQGAFAAVTLDWPDELTYVSSTCEGWVGADIDRQLRGEPQAEDECLVDLAGAGGEGRSSGEAEVTFTTPPTGFAETVSARLSRIVTIEDEDADVIEHDMDADSDYEEAIPIDVQPYPFWLDVTVDPLWVPSGEPRPVTVTVHRTPPADGSDDNAVMTFDVAVPAFARFAGMEGCDDVNDDGTQCTLEWYDYEPYSVTALLEVPEGLRDAGLVRATGVTETGTDSLQPTDAGSIQGGEALFVTADGLFPVTVAVEPSEAAPGDAVRARIEVGNAGFPTGVDSFQGGTWALGIQLTWPTSLFRSEPPQGCSYVDGVCNLRGPEPGETAVIELSFTVTDETFESGDVVASGVSLTHDPTTEDDRHDDRKQPTVSYPPEWIGTGTAEFSPF